MRECQGEAMTRIGEPLAQLHASSLPRIVILISTRIVGGPAKGILQVVPDLQRQGRFDVIVCPFANRGEPESPFIRACRDRKIPLHILHQRFHFDWQPLRDIRGLLNVPRAVVQTHGYKEAIFGLLARNMSGKRWIAFQHGTTQENMKVRLYHRLDRHITARANAIVAVSRELADRRIGPSGRGRLHIIENAVDKLPMGRVRDRCTQIAADAVRPVIGCIGRLSPEKGHRELIAAAGILAAQGMDFSLVFAGDGPERPHLEATARAAGLCGRIRFLGHVARVEDLYAELDMLVLPSRREGMPNVILEAMQYGLPIVATRVGAIPEMITDHVSGLLVPAGDHSALARAMGAFLKDVNRARTFGRRARESLYPRFSPERRLARFEELYDGILETS